MKIDCLLIENELNGIELNLNELNPLSTSGYSQIFQLNSQTFIITSLDKVHQSIRCSPTNYFHLMFNAIEKAEKEQDQLIQRLCMRLLYLTKEESKEQTFHKVSNRSTEFHLSCNVF